MSFKEYIKSLEQYKDIKKLNIITNDETIVNESSLSRLYKHYKKHDSGTISAFRSELKYDENMKNTRLLKNHLLANDFSVTQIMGNYNEIVNGEEIVVKEVSFIVIDINNKGNLKEILLKAGSNFNQESITFSKPGGDYFLIYCMDKKEIKLGEPMFGKNGEIKSKVNGRPFVFENLINNERHIINDTIKNYNPSLTRYEIRKFKILKD